MLVYFINYLYMDNYNIIFTLSFILFIFILYIYSKLFIISYEHLTNEEITKNIGTIYGKDILNIKDIETKKITAANFYPIGALYLSTNKLNPATTLGFGTWEQIINSLLFCGNKNSESGKIKYFNVSHMPSFGETCNEYKRYGCYVWKRIT